MSEKIAVDWKKWEENTKARPVHFDKTGGYGESLCGYGAGNPDVRWTESVEKTTCKNCQRVMEAAVKRNLKNFGNHGPGLYDDE